MKTLAQSTALLVDDDEITRLLLTDMLESLGMGTVLTASNGQEGLRVLKKSTALPEFIVLDVFMPDMDGIEFIGKLRPFNFTGAIILVSGAVSDSLVIARTMVTGMGLDLRATLLKPVDPRAMAEALAPR
jgi:CheY-like chemotaxis protein